jgi:hypothetical protein
LTAIVTPFGFGSTAAEVIRDVDLGGRDFEDCNEAPVVEKRRGDFLVVAPYANDAYNAQRLWETSLLMVR